MKPEWWLRPSRFCLVFPVDNLCEGAGCCDNQSPFLMFDPGVPLVDTGPPLHEEVGKLMSCVLSRFTDGKQRCLVCDFMENHRLKAEQFWWEL